ncbi:NLGN4X [Branchiostoma lanceolatum]|uniref:NLGN4X protein n=1 Tax=Branchiostoma lanceolatum TaxID=7740 RepID=A0A8K0A7Z6_BRALA|nr:NLGN4X [Branchiostoma lanceolatum]
MEIVALLARWCVLALALARLTQGSHVVRDTSYGKVRGNVTATTGGKQVQVFLGVPYARGPVGDRRFKPPERPETSYSVRNAYRPGPACPQPANPATDSVGDSEDCLYLNIYVPHKSSSRSTSYPVVVFVHGGDYMFGTGSAYDGSLLAATQNIVVVTINYRLGVLGFLSAGDPGLLGNYGIRDQMMALQWVKTNIGYFGGSGSDVTLFGHQTGADCAAILLLSPMAKGLFKRVILSGSSPLRPRLLRSADDMRRESYQLAVTFNCGGYDNAAGIADCLRKLKYEVFLQRETDGSVPGSALAPVLDGQVVPAFPDQMLRRVQVNGEACLLGFTGREWAPRAVPGSASVAMDGGMSDTDFHHHMDLFLKDLSPYAPPELAALVTYQYTNWSQAGDRFTTTDNYIQAISDALFVAPAVSSAERMVALDLPSYVYQYEFPTAEGDSRTPIKDDVFLIFSPASAGGPLTQREQILRLRLADLFGSFVRTGVPKWQSRSMNTFTAGRQDYLKIGGEEAEIDRYPRRRQVTFWNEVFPSLLRVVDKTRRSPRPTKPTKVSRPTEESPDITWTTKGIIIGIMVIGIFLPVMTAFFVMYVADFKQQRLNRKLLYQMSDEHRYAPPPTIQVNDKPYHLQLSEDV